MKTLKDVQVGETVTVVKLHGEGPVKRRIMDMGITKGTEVYVRKVAPLGDPMEVTVRGYELSLRKADAEMIEVSNRFGWRNGSALITITEIPKGEAQMEQSKLPWRATRTAVRPRCSTR